MIHPGNQLAVLNKANADRMENMLLQGWGVLKYIF